MMLQRLFLFVAVSLFIAVSGHHQAANASGPSEGLYIADPMRAMIFAMPLDAEAGEPVPFSGAVQIAAQTAVLLGEDEVVFTPTGGGGLQHATLSTGEVAALGFPESVEQGFLGPGLHSDEFFLMSWDTSRILHATVYRRAEPGAQWETKTHDLATTMASTAFHQFKYLMLTSPESLEDPPAFAILSYWNSRWQLAIAGGETGLIELGPLAETFVPHPGFLARGPDGLFAHIAAHPAAGYSAAVYNSEGARLHGHPLESADLATSQTVPLSWQDQPPAAYGIRRHAGELAVQHSSLTDPPQALYTSLDSENRYRVGNDISNAWSLVLEDGNWYTHDGYTGYVNRIDLDAQETEPLLLYRIGEGPPFEMIESLATGPDGLLYVLDDRRRIMRVTPGTGNRQVLIDFHAPGVHPGLEVTPDGKLAILVHRPHSGHSAILTVDPLAQPPALEEFARIDIPAQPKEFRVLPSGGAIVLYHPGSGPSVVMVSSSGETEFPLIPVTRDQVHFNSEQAQPGSSQFIYSYESGINFMRDVLIDTMSVTLHSKEGVQAGDLHRTMRDAELTAPNGDTFAAGAPNFRFSTYPGPTHSFAMTWEFPLGAPMRTVQGDWGFKVELGGTFPSHTPPPMDFERVTFQPAMLSRSILLAPLHDGSGRLAVLSRFPPDITLMAANFAELETVPLLLNGTPETVASPLNRQTDFIIAQDGTCFVSVYDEMNIYRFNPETGVTELWVTDVPEPFGGEHLGKLLSSHISLAIAPYVLTAKGGWVLLFN